MTRNAVLLFSPDVYRYTRGGKHPATPDRLRRTFELLEEYHAFDDAGRKVLAPRMATEQEIAAFHTPEYIHAVQALSQGAFENNIPEGIAPERYGFRTGGNPIFAGMYEAGAIRVGGALQAVELLKMGQAQIVFHPAGGGHHGMPGRTSGFCIFNDIVIAIKKFLEHGMRVAYVDIDAHHGDGVQAAFYDEPRVLTISLHESGDTLFPGTGDVDEVGEGTGRGLKINVPFLRGTTDDIYLHAFCQVVPQAVKRFKPDVLVTQMGADAHYLDPLAHLNLTTNAYVEMTRTFRELMPGKWLAVGGGGYRASVVPRVWSLIWGEITATNLADELPAAYRDRYAEIDFLRDTESPVVDPITLAQADQNALECVEFLRGEISLLSSLVLKIPSS